MYQLLQIDDDPLIAKIIKNALPSDCNLTSVNNGNDGIAWAKKNNPDVILLDVEMPEKNGYEVCDALKHDPLTAHVPVIFVSSKASLRERILGYEMGGDDYLEKPFDPDILFLKINKIREIASEKIKLLNKIDQATKTAQDALTGSSELSLMVRYQQGIQNINSHEKVVSCFFDITKQLGLSTCLMIEIDHNKIFYSSSGENKPLEQEMMYMLFQQQKRFSDFGCRTQITYPNMALLVKDMPLNDSCRYGRLKDLLPIMIETTANKLSAIETELLLQQQNNDVKNAASLTQITLQEVINSFHNNQKRGQKLLHGMLGKLQDRLPNMGLEEDQEKFIFKTIDDGIANAYDLTDDSVKLSTALANIMKIFNDIQIKQAEILKLYQIKRDAAEDAPGILNDVELF